MTIKDKLGLASEPVFLMDGTAYIYRSFYAQRHLQRSDGFPTNALVLTARILLRILREENPEYFLFAMDGKGKNFRSTLYDQYKANREAMPEDLALQIAPIQRMVDALGLAREVADGVEADDCIASLAAKFSADHPVIIISGDKDLKQCLSANVFMWDPGAKEEKLLTLDDFIAENGVTPAQWPDVQAIIGDSSDNIPGIAGIGPKTAKQIFSICHSLEDINNNLDKLPPKIRAKLEPGLKDMFLWRELTTLRLDALSEKVLADIKVGPINIAACSTLTGEFELVSLRKEIDALLENRAQKQPLLTVFKKEEAAVLPGLQTTLLEAKTVSDASILPACQQRDVAIVWPEGFSGQIRVAVGEIGGHKSCGEEYNWCGSMADLCHWLKDAREIVVQDLKPLIVKMPSWQKLLLENPHPSYIDLGLASYLLNPEEGDYSLDRITSRWCEEFRSEGAGPACLALIAAFALRKNLAANNMTELYENMELPLELVLAKMEIRGIAISPKSFHSFLDEVEKEAAALEKKIYEEAGEVFNIRSSQQLAEVLFERLRLSAGRKTKGGQPSTSQLALEKLAAAHPVVANVLQYRKLEKMRSTYLDPLPRLMDDNDRLHTTFNQEATATGRLSSSNPNLQNIPVRGEMGKRMRSCFVANKDNLLIAADYSQIELRLLAHFSQDETLLAAFRNGEDIHGRTAALVFDIDQKNISPDQRRMAKTINFGLLYGMGAQKLSQELKIGISQAKDFIERYFSRLSGVRKFYDNVLESARQNGYVTTMAGRRRWLPGIFSSNGQIAAQAQRQAINAVIQGSAADIIKLAMLAAENDNYLNDNNVKLVLQIHDELLLEAPERIAEDAAARTAKLMETAKPAGVEISIPLVVDWGTGANWGQAH